MLIGWAIVIGGADGDGDEWEGELKGESGVNREVDPELLGKSKGISGLGVNHKVKSAVMNLQMKMKVLGVYRSSVCSSRN